MSTLLIWVLVTVLVLLVVVPLLRTASRLLRGEDEMVAGGSWGRQLFGRKDRGRQPPGG